MKTLSRRAFLHAGAMTSATLLAACQPKIVTVEKVVKETVEVIKEVEVEKVVKETVEVEKVVVQAGKPPDLVRVTGWFGIGEVPKDIQPMLDKFEAEKNVRLVFETSAGGDDMAMMQRLLAAFAAGNAQDLHRSWGPYMRMFIEKGVALDFTPYIEKEWAEELKDFIPAQLEAARLDGKQYGLPQYCGIRAMRYNRDLFDEAGVDYPTADWGPDDLVAAAQKLTLKDAGGRPKQFGVLGTWNLEFEVSTHIWTWGGEVHEPSDNRICRMGEPIALEAMQWLADLLFEHHVAAIPAEVTALQVPGAGNLYQMGTAAIKYGGSWEINGDLNTFKANFAWDCVPHIKGPTGGRTTFCTTDTWLGNRNVRSQDAVWEGIKFLTGVEFQTHQIKMGYLQPVRVSLGDVWLQTVSDRIMQVNPKLDQVNLAAFTDGFNYARPMVYFSGHNEAMELLNPVLDQIYKLGTARPAEVIPAVCDQITELLTKA